MVQNQDFSNLFVPWIDTEVNTENITIQNDNSTIDDSQEPASVEDTNDGYKSANSSINEEIISEQNQFQPLENRLARGNHPRDSMTTFYIPRLIQMMRNHKLGKKR